MRPYRQVLPSLGFAALDYPLGCSAPTHRSVHGRLDPAAAAHTALYSARQNQPAVKLTTVNGAENWADAEVV